MNIAFGIIIAYALITTSVTAHKFLVRVKKIPDKKAATEILPEDSNDVWCHGTILYTPHNVSKLFIKDTDFDLVETAGREKFTIQELHALITSAQDGGYPTYVIGIEVNDILGMQQWKYLHGITSMLHPNDNPSHIIIPYETSLQNEFHIFVKIPEEAVLVLPESDTKLYELHFLYKCEITQIQGVSGTLMHQKYNENNADCQLMMVNLRENPSATALFANLDIRNLSAFVLFLPREERIGDFVRARVLNFFIRRGESITFEYMILPKIMSVKFAKEGTKQEVVHKATVDEKNRKLTFTGNALSKGLKYKGLSISSDLAEIISLFESNTKVQVYAAYDTRGLGEIPSDAFFEILRVGTPQALASDLSNSGDKKKSKVFTEFVVSYKVVDKRQVEGHFP